MLCQPKRGNSLGLFLEMLRGVNEGVDIGDSGGDGDESGVGGGGGGKLFDFDWYDRYDDEIVRMHDEFLAQNDSRGGEVGGDDDGGDNDDSNDGSNSYNPDIHYPLLLVVRKVREYNEEMDTNAALHHLHRQKKQ